MAQISLTLPSDGTTIEAADVNNPLNAILNEFNGNIDDNNIKSGANISGTKILANSIAPASLDANGRAGWRTGILSAPNTITALGNRSYSMVFNTTDLTGYISAGMRLRTTRTTAAPTQCTSLNGTTQYYSKSSPSAMTFTDDFTVSAWVKLTSYAISNIASRYNGTSGWEMGVDAGGRVYVTGYNAGAANFSQVLSNLSVPLNKWVHVAAQLDMSAFTATPTTSYTMIDGVDVPAAVSRGGTNPTSLINNVGDLEIGAQNGATRPFPGKIAQVAIYNAKVTQATILASMPQTLSGSETSLISAYSFNNVITDLNTTNANNLSAQASAAATSTDSPFGGQADGTISTTLDYAIVTKTAFSTNTTLTVQVPEGCTIPTSGGVSAVAYSEHKVPYGFPAQKGKWRVASYLKLSTGSQSSPVQNTWYNLNSFQLNIPLGEWMSGHKDNFEADRGAAGILTIQSTLSTANNSETDNELTIHSESSGATLGSVPAYVEKGLSLSAATIYYLNGRVTNASATNLYNTGNLAAWIIWADLSHL